MVVNAVNIGVFSLMRQHIKAMYEFKRIAEYINNAFCGALYFFVFIQNLLCKLFVFNYQAFVHFVIKQNNNIAAHNKF